MTGNEYQKLAARTISIPDHKGQEMHALHGMVSELGEVHDIYQHSFQGEAINDKHLQKEVGDLLWFIAEYCTSRGWLLDDIMKMNIDKLIARYPDGFDAQRSIDRKEEL